MNLCVLLTSTAWLAGETLTMIAGGGAAMVIVALADLLLSLTEVAVNFTVAGLGTLGGAV